MTRACAATADLLLQVRDDQLLSATPCEGMALAAMIAHIGGLADAFAAAAPVAGDAPLLDRVVALTGRNPGWTP